MKSLNAKLDPTEQKKNQPTYYIHDKDSKPFSNDMLIFFKFNF
jgi:hypothetical protein